MGRLDEVDLSASLTPEESAARLSKASKRLLRLRLFMGGQLEEAGFDPAIVRRVVRLVDVAEWKRRQAPIGVRVTPKAFGKDRRLPITNGWTG